MQQSLRTVLDARGALSRYQRSVEELARGAGITHAIYQLLAAVKNHPGDVPPSVGELAGYLYLRQHTVVGLIDRAQAAGVARREKRAGVIVRVVLTELGEEVAESLTPGMVARLEELCRSLPAPGGNAPGNPGETPQA